MQGRPFSCETSRIRFPLFPRSPALSTKACPAPCTCIFSITFLCKNFPGIIFPATSPTLYPLTLQPIRAASHPLIVPACPHSSPFTLCKAFPFSPSTPVKKQVSKVTIILKRSFKLKLLFLLKYFFNSFIKVLLFGMPVHTQKCLLLPLSHHVYASLLGLFFCLLQLTRTHYSKHQRTFHDCAGLVYMYASQSHP